MLFILPVDRLENFLYNKDTIKKGTQAPHRATGQATGREGKKMTAREYAAECEIELVGKLTKKISKSERWNAYKGEMVIISNVYYIDEAGNEISGNKADGWEITTADGAVI